MSSQGRTRFEEGRRPQRDHGSSHRSQRREHPYASQRSSNSNLSISERISRERPSRTLFVRNVSYNTTEADVRKLFEQFGELKRLFSLVDQRGMAFVTYFDLRSAEKAKEHLQGYEIEGRAIDVHFALPKDEEGGEEQNTGTLFFTLKQTETIPDNRELNDYFEQFGELREIRDVKGSPFQKFVEYYDIRSSEKAMNEAQGATLLGGIVHLRIAHPSKTKPREGGNNRDRDRDQDYDRGRNDRNSNNNGNYDRSRDGPYSPPPIHPQQPSIAMGGMMGTPSPGFPSLPTSQLMLPQMLPPQTGLGAYNPMLNQLLNPGFPGMNPSLVQNQFLNQLPQLGGLPQFQNVPTALPQMGNMAHTQNPQLQQLLNILANSQGTQQQPPFR